jgi:hypothetical protein
MSKCWLFQVELFLLTVPCLTSITWVFHCLSHHYSLYYCSCMLFHVKHTHINCSKLLSYLSSNTVCVDCNAWVELTGSFWHVHCCLLDCDLLCWFVDCIQCVTGVFQHSSAAAVSQQLVHTAYNVTAATYPVTPSPAYQDTPGNTLQHTCLPRYYR